MGIISSAINTGGGILSTLLGNHAAKKQQQREQQWASEQADKANAFTNQQREAQNQWNLDMWNRQNEYNDPSAQMERMTNAGINPQAAAQGIAGAGSTADGASTASNGAGQMAQASSIAASLGQNIGDLMNDFYQRRKVEADAKGQEIDNDWKPTINETTIRQMEADIDEKVSKKELNEAEAQQCKELLPLLKDKTAAETEQVWVAIDKLMSDIDVNNKEMEKMDKEMEKMDSDIAVNESTIALNSAKATEAYANAGKAVQDTKNASIEESILQFEAGMREAGIDPKAKPVQNLINAAVNGNADHVIGAVKDAVTDWSKNGIGHQLRQAIPISHVVDAVKRRKENKVARQTRRNIKQGVRRTRREERRAEQHYGNFPTYDWKN